MNVRCGKCGTVNSVGASQPGTRYRCGECSAFLPPAKEEGGDTSAAVGLLGGAALGAALGGPPGAVIGAIVGAILGKSAKGIG
jgi:outer membrane lipoprotein SlyB